VLGGDEGPLSLRVYGAVLHSGVAHEGRDTVDARLTRNGLVPARLVIDLVRLMGAARATWIRRRHAERPSHRP
jgi:hypothetical protein